MKINSSITTFKGATLNINAFSDTHGQLDNISDFFNTIEQNKRDLFLKNKKGVKNVTAIVGDWYMAGNVRGYLSKPDYNSQKFQLIFFNKLIKQIKHICNSAITIFTPGNHDFDAGFKEFEECIRKMDAKIVASNVDFKNSKKSLGDKILKSYVVGIQDDKNPDKMHKVLFVGIVPGNMKYYNKKLSGIAFFDNAFKPQASLTPQDVQNTIKEIKKEIDKFKNQNPKGAIVMLDHFGGIFRKELLAQKLPVDIILGAHEHDDFEEHINNTHIITLYQNFKKLQNIKLRFDDDGNIDFVRTRAYYPQKSDRKNPMSSFFEMVFKKDLKTSFYIPAEDGIKELELKGIRYQNSYLANYITDVILNRIRKKYPQTDFFALNASAIRGQLKTENSGSINNINLLTTLNGIKEEEANILISRVTGEEILNIILGNLTANAKNKDRNPLMHFSGLKIERTLLLNGLKLGVKKEDLIKFIRKTDTNEPLELEKEYTLANVEKFFLKSKNPIEKEIYASQKTMRTDINAKREFRAHFVENINEVKASKEIRIIS